MTKLSNWQSFVFRITKPRHQDKLIQQQDRVLLNWRETVTSPVANGSTAFKWKLCCHWLQGLWCAQWQHMKWKLCCHWLQGLWCGQWQCSFQIKAVLLLATRLVMWPMAAQLSNESYAVIGYKACDGPTPHRVIETPRLTETLAWCLTRCSNESIQYLISFSRDCKWLRELELKNWHKLGFLRVTRRANANNWCGLMRPHFFAFEFY